MYKKNVYDIVLQVPICDRCDAAKGMSTLFIFLIKYVGFFPEFHWVNINPAM